MARKTDNKTHSDLLTDALLAAALAWLVPGAGHVFLRRHVRGIVIFVVIATLFWGGVGMGGVLTVDQYNERWWFAAEMLAGVHGLYGWQREANLYNDLMKRNRLDPPLPDPGGEVSAAQMRMDEALADKKLALVAPVDTVARAYAGVAGMLNLMCIFGAVALALMGVRGERPRPRDDEEPLLAAEGRA